MNSRLFYQIWEGKYRPVSLQPDLVIKPLHLTFNPDLLLSKLLSHLNPLRAFKWTNSGKMTTEASAAG